MTYFLVQVIKDNGFMEKKITTTRLFRHESKAINEIEEYKKQIIRETHNLSWMNCEICGYRVTLTPVELED